MKLREGNVFTPIYHSVRCGRGCLPQCILEYTPPRQTSHPLGRHPPPPADTPPGADSTPGQTPLLGRHLPWAITPTGQTSPLGRHPPYPYQQTATQHRIQWPGRGGPRNMKSMWPSFLWPIFTGLGGPWPLGTPPGSATATAAGGMHPTGIHSFCYNSNNSNSIYFSLWLYNVMSVK